MVQSVYSRGWKEALWDRYFTGAPRRQRRSVERYNYSEESLRVLARRRGINAKTVANWFMTLSICKILPRRERGLSSHPCISGSRNLVPGPPHVCSVSGEVEQDRPSCIHAP